jgi:ParB family chromosome partitioning protein
MPKTAAAVSFAPETSTPPPVVMRAIETLYLATEAPPEANLVVRDSSRGSPMTDAELKASIYAKGIIQPLIWKTYKGKDYVVAGNRRLRFLREIFADAPASTVQTQNVDLFGGDWREVAIDTNLSLPPHLVERFELIVKLAADLKLSPEDTRARFGMSTRQYNQVMALGKMSPTIRQAWKDAAIDAKTAQAFTLEPDPKEQDRIFAALMKNAYQGRIGDHQVRGKIVPSTQRETGKLVAFVGLDAVRAAKLLKQEDMFGDDHVVTDVKGLNKLAGDKMAVECKRLTDAGWSWALPDYKLTDSKWHFGSIDPAKKEQPTAEEKLRLKQLQDLIDSDPPDNEDYDDEPYIAERERITEAVKERGYTEAQRAKSGCIIQIGRDGKLSIEYGRVNPSEKKSVAASERAATTSAKKQKAKKPGQAQLTNALAERLSEQLEKAVAASMHATPHVAVAAIIAGFATDGHVIDVTVGGSEGGDYSRRHARGSGTNEKNFAQVFEGAVKATSESRAVMLMKIAAAAVSIQIMKADSKAPIDGLGLQALVAKMDAKTLNAAIADTFDAKDYFAGVSASASVAAVRCSMGDEHGDKVAKMKKGEAAKFAAANVPAKGWLPRELRTVHYKGPVESTPKPKALAAKKAAAKKPAAKTAKKKTKK